MQTVSIIVDITNENILKQWTFHMHFKESSLTENMIVFITQLICFHVQIPHKIICSRCMFFSQYRMDLVNFVNKLGDYLKVSKTYSNEHFWQCWTLYLSFVFLIKTLRESGPALTRLNVLSKNLVNSFQPQYKAKSWKK